MSILDFFSSKPKFTSVTTPKTEVATERGARKYFKKLSHFTMPELCIELSHVRAAKYNLTSMPSGLNDFERTQALVADLNDKTLTICMVHFGKEIVIRVWQLDPRGTNTVIDRTDNVVAEQDLEPEQHGHELLYRLTEVFG
jgi:hypothetical protein